MEAQPDFRDLLQEFNAAGVEYLIVGAHALAAHGFVRATRDKNAQLVDIKTWLTSKSSKR